MKQIHDFAIKWLNKFCNQNINYIELVDHYIADDCGYVFEDVYGDAVNN